MMYVPDNEDIREQMENDLYRTSKNPVMKCDLCGRDIFEGDDYLDIEEWDKCVCESCADDIGVWQIAE